MDYKQFSSHGSKNPHSDISVRRTLREYPIKRNTFGKSKSKAIKNKLTQTMKNNDDRFALHTEKEFGR